MPTEIKQLDLSDERKTIFRVEGEMFRADAELLSRLAADRRDATGNRIVIDLADLDLLDSEAAAVLRPLANRDGFELVGIEIFLQSAVDMAERL